MSPLKLQFSSSPEDHSWHDCVQRELERVVSECGMAGMEAMLLPSAVVEAINNIIEHAYENVPGKPILIEVGIDAGGLVVVLRDRGRAMPQPLPPGNLPAADAEGGRGWKIIRTVFPVVHYERVADENLLCLTRPLDADDAAGRGEAMPSA
jgi:anti-sigma regulatory factor (Ser/Thr protein kinase)